MLEFMELLQLTKQMSKKLAPQSIVNSLCCSSFFGMSSTFMNHQASQDAMTLGYFSSAMEGEFYDEGLKKYLAEESSFGLLYGTALIEFKRQVLCGMFLLTWSHYNNAVSSYWNDCILGMCKEALEVDSPNDFESFDQCLAALSCYCSYVYKHRTEPVFCLIYNQLGESIQSDISILQTEKYKCDNSIYGVYTGIMNTISF